MLVIALILVAFACLIFTVNFFKTVFENAIMAGLAFFSGGVACWLIDILHGQGKL